MVLSAPAIHVQLLFEICIFKVMCFAISLHMQFYAP